MANRGGFHSLYAFLRALTRLRSRAGPTVFRHTHTLRSTRQQRRQLLDSVHPVKPCNIASRSVRQMASSAPATHNTGQSSTRALKTTNYEDAVVALNSLQSNAETIKKSLQFRNESRKLNIPNMINYVQRVGLSMEDVDKLSVIHVTGTKGKGSTCAFAESILRQHGYKTGIFSSPHLIEARERIRINGRPIERDLFSNYFWEVFDKLQATKDAKESGMPHYFSFLTVMALCVFVREGVDVALLEVGIGGQYDSTNLVRSPLVCGVSSLDLDHTNLLGNTLQDIAWHKGGIFKKGAPAFTVPQPDCAMQVLLQRAQENECPLYIASPLKEEELSGNKGLKLGIAGHKQSYNAALAVQLCQVWLSARSTGYTENNNKGPSLATVFPTSIQSIPIQRSSHLSQQMIKGLCECRWPGRTQVVQTPGVTYYLDGAHTTDSMQQCVDWFAETADEERKRLRSRVRRVLVFNMTGDRCVSALLAKLKVCGFHMAAFCPNVVSTIASENIPDQLNLTVDRATVVKKSQTNRQAWDKLMAEESTGHQQAPAAQMVALCNGDGATSLLQQDSAAADGDGDGGLAVATAVDATQGCVSSTFPCIASALQWATAKKDCPLQPPSETIHHVSAESRQEHIQVLVTGSLHLVGGVLELITPNMNDE